MPAWYPPFNRLVRAARYLGCSVFDLLDKPSVWERWALEAAQAEDIVLRNRTRP